MSLTIRCLILLLVLQPLAILSAEASIGSGSVDANAFVKMFIGLVFTILIIFALAWLSRKTKLIQTLNSGYQIKTLASHSLTHREKLCLIEVGDKHILIGLAPGSINKLHVFEEPVDALQPEANHSSQNLFSKQLKQALGMQKQAQKD